MWPLRNLIESMFDSPSPAPAPALTPAKGLTQPATILLADDDDIVRAAVRSVLRKCGYRVLEASSGMEAVLLAAQEEGPIDMVLADVIMPSLTTDELSSRLKALRPGTPIAFMSGYIQDEKVRDKVLHGPTPFLAKPFAIDDLTRTVRRVLDDRNN